MDNKWSDRLRRQMETHVEYPPEGLWESIEQAMDRQGKPSYGTSPKIRRMLLWGVRAGAAAAVVAFAVLIGNKEIDRGIVNGPVDKVYVDNGSAGNTVSHPGTDITDIIDTRKGISADGTSAASGATRATARHEQKPAPAPEPGTEPEHRPDPEPEQEPEPRKEPETAAAEKQPAQPGKTAERQERTFDFATDPEIRVPRQKKGKKWSAGLYASNIMPVSAAKNSLQDVNNARAGSPMYSSGIFDHDASSIVQLSKVREVVYTDIKHTPPVTVGLSVSYGLGEKWSLTSGLTYAMLSSRFQSLDYHSAQQVLHYIGVPLNINYSIWNGNRLSIYLSGGGIVEKNVSAIRTTQRPVGDGLKVETKKAIPLDRLQWSVSGSMGAQYDFVKWMGLYVEPGIGYYFNNNSDLETVYKAKPLNFGLRLGLRFSL